MIDAGKAAGEFMFLGLRMTRGICTVEFSRRFGKSPGELYPQIREWSDKGLIEQHEKRLKLTRRGLLVADAIFVNFV
jgi:oxygen-independent coproporphyrinogen-3 oxidase